jgi:flagellar hook-length control protein FliK
MRRVPFVPTANTEMTMHTNFLPIPLNATVAPAQNPRVTMPVTSDGVNFGAALTQQIQQRQTEQRQLEQRQAPVRPQPPAQPNVAPQQAVAAPKPQAAAKPAANDAKPAPRASEKQPAKDTAQADAADKTDSAKATTAEDKTAAAEGDTEDATTSADAKAADAVVDMLALVASFNQVPQAAAVVVPAAPQPAAAQADALLASMQGSLKDGAGPLVKLDTDALTTDAPQEKAQPGIDLRAVDLGKAGEAAKLPVENADFAAALRDSAAQAASLKEAPASTEALASLAAQASALQTAQAAGSVPLERLSARVGTPAWDNQVGQKVIWMAGGEDQSATLELNPPDLGPVQVVLNVSNDLASVTFSSQQLEVRQALENALPRLREMMSESGIALGNASVNAGAEGRQGQDGQGSGRQGGSGGKGHGGDSALAEVTPRQRTSILGGAGAVDTFA